MESKNLVKSLINASEKAANIARKCREDENLLSLLIEEKSVNEANPRFVQDFKTLADVLIQEVIRHDIGLLFPELRENIKGEESPNFTNTLGESVCVEIGETAQITADCLERVLNGNKLAAELLAAEVHKHVKYNDSIGNIPDLPSDLNYCNIGIWIDPIDATAEYIKGDTVFTDFPEITSSGLDCVTVLIGCYDKITGASIIGVVNQPFHKKISDKLYESKIFWGISLGQMFANNIVVEKDSNQQTNICVVSISENEKILQILKDFGYQLAFSSGAGHKALKVITNEADLYLLSKGSTFKWDTCGPQAILQSLYGGIFNYKKCLIDKDVAPIVYFDDETKCNCDGIIAIKNFHLIAPLLDKLSQ